MLSGVSARIVAIGGGKKFVVPLLAEKLDYLRTHGCGSDEGHVEQEARANEPRRRLAMKGFGRLADGTPFPLTLVEISYNGCKIQTDLALLPGVIFTLSIIECRGSVDAQVRWHKDGHAGLQFIAEDEAEKPTTPRAHEREKLEASVCLRRPGGQRYNVALYDLTPSGCKVEFVERPRPGDVFWAKWEGLEAVEATVAWVDAFCVGLKFARPLHPAIFEALVSRLKSGF